MLGPTRCGIVTPLKWLATMPPPCLNEEPDTATQVAPQPHHASYNYVSCCPDNVQRNAKEVRFGVMRTYKG